MQVVLHSVPPPAVVDMFDFICMGNTQLKNRCPIWC